MFMFLLKKCIRMRSFEIVNWEEKKNFNGTLNWSFLVSGFGLTTNATVMTARTINFEVEPEKQKLGVQEYE